MMMMRMMILSELFQMTGIKVSKSFKACIFENVSCGKMPRDTLAPLTLEQFQNGQVVFPGSKTVDSSIVILVFS